MPHLRRYFHQIIHNFPLSRGVRGVLLDKNMRFSTAPGVSGV